MKKILILGCCTCIGIGTANASINLDPGVGLLGCTSVSSCPSGAMVYYLADPVCATSTTNYLKNADGTKCLQYKSCTSCSGVAELTSENFATSATHQTVCGNTISKTRNVCDCGTKCDDKPDNIDWTSTGISGYQAKTTYTCDMSTDCEVTTSYSYRCAAGYYGSPINGRAGCTRCPATGLYTNSALSASLYGTSAAGSTTKTSCYIPSGTVFYDATGSGTYAGNSYYCE